MRKLVESHRFFCRKSQHFVLGNWYEYEPWSGKKLRFTLYFPIAYVKFMGYILRDMWRLRGQATTATV